MVQSMQHYNGDLLCVIDTETTGLDPFYHEILTICIIPLDATVRPLKTVMPFNMEFKPEYPERIDLEAIKVNKLDLATITNRGYDKMKMIDLFEAWHNKLDLPYTKGGVRKKLVPLGQNYAFDMMFIKAWLGAKAYDSYFSYHYRDTMLTAGYLNDRANFRSEKVPFSKINLTYLASTLKIQHDHAHDAMQDCLVTAEVYRRQLTMCDMGIL